MSWQDILKAKRFEQEDRYELGNFEHGVQEDKYRCQLCGYESDDEEDFANHDCTPDMLREMQFELENT
tara:strand:+ start:150 stop:353 length:204 start_codon:yes stop_codon:yes gene_type:complete